MPNSRPAAKKSAAAFQDDSNEVSNDDFNLMMAKKLNKFKSSIISDLIENMEVLISEFQNIIQKYKNQLEEVSSTVATVAITLYKAFIQTNLDYADIIYDKPNNMNICNKILRFNAALAITGAIRGSSKEKLYQELGFEYFSSRRWLRKLCLFYEIVVKKSPNYLYNYVSTVNQSYQTRSSDKFLHMCCRTKYFANSFFRYTIKEWNNLSLEIRKSVSYEVFKNSLLKFIRPSPNSLFNVSDSPGIKILTRLRLGLSHLREH